MLEDRRAEIAPPPPPGLRTTPKRIGKEHPLRVVLFELLKSRPGLSPSELAREVERGWGTVQHHLRSLEERGLVARYSTPRENRFFPAGIPETRMREVALLRRGRVWDVARLILAQPGIGLSSLSSSARMSRKVLRDYLRVLVEDDFVVRKRSLLSGQKLFPGPQLKFLQSDDPLDAVVARLCAEKSA